MAGYSVTVQQSSAATHAFAASAIASSGATMPEFLPVTEHAPALQVAPSTAALGLNAMWVVNTSRFMGQASGAVVAHLASQPGVAHAEKILLQSTDHRYLSCDYKLRDNTLDQSVAAAARQALLSAGVSASLLDDAGTAEFVSIRTLNSRPYLQVAFVRRPVLGTTAVYVGFVNSSTQRVVATARANWYAVDLA